MIVGSIVAWPILFMIGSVWPAYQTYKAIATNESESMARWLQYWLIVSIISTFEWVVDMVGVYFPFYYEGKIVFALWLTMDKYKGTTFLFKKFLEPLLTDKTHAIDEKIDFVAKRLKNFKVEDIRVFVDWAKTQDVRGVVQATLSAKAAPVVEKVVEQQVTDKPLEPEDDAEVIKPETEEEKKGK